MAARKWRWPSAPPPSAYHGEIVALTTPSGYSLAVTASEPRGVSRGTVILLHSMAASAKIFQGRANGRGFSQTLVDCGLRTLSLDFRGHGGSSPTAAQGGNWTYDDLVREDVPALVRAARERWPGERLCIVGHSMGGHIGLASVAAGYAEADRIVTLATSVWLPGLDASPVVRARKAAALRLAEASVRVRGYLPMRSLGLGTDDESAGFVRSVARFWKEEAWTSESGMDYLERVEKISVPVLAVASAGDTYVCCPDTALRFARLLPPEHLSFELVRTADDGGAAPGHMTLVTTRVAESLWHRVATFCSAP